ncbi:hypothetical protein JIG36_00320 [Actinoplanes sp. LDG1-06]|uniref:Phage tail protein n=1 Tax=Paractinoplanes ovalisporus TaxID=2810368 RepID=A0ABS2A3Y8_9ACTN|nr:phage tail protein [Actinoplanes ovalisporus]MBM2613999.1 hypothetical protein [Actinoplanes ovalisporus]
MTEPSSYLRYLPPVLWRDDPAPPEFSLGAALRIFEKVLTGIDDGVRLPHGDHDHPAITAAVDRLPELADPWRTPEPFLPWLASWLSLEFPALQGTGLWDEYQRRKATAEIAAIHRQRGLRAGLNRYLDLTAAGAVRPRVAIDDGSRLLAVVPRPGERVVPFSLQSQGPVINGSTVSAEGLIRPWAVAAAPDGTLFVGDAGVSASIPLPLKSRVWRLGPSGAYDLTEPPVRPLPLARDTLALTQVAGVALRPAAGGAAETLFILDRPGRLSSLAAPYLTSAPVTVANLTNGNIPFRPIAMTVDTNGDVLVLDRAGGAGTPNPPQIVTVAGSTVTRKPLKTVTEPLSLLVLPDRRLVIGDGTGTLVRVDRSGADWTETALLPPGNTLIAPTAVVRSTDTLFYVLDAGLRPFTPPGADPFVLTVAEPAVVRAVDLTTTPVRVRAVTEPGHLVFPTAMVAAGGRLVVCDPGQPEVPGIAPVWSRLQPSRFGVVLHFTDGRLPAEAKARTAVRRRVAAHIRTTVDQQKPAHTLWNLVSAI